MCCVQLFGQHGATVADIVHWDVPGRSAVGEQPELSFPL